MKQLLLLLTAILLLQCSSNEKKERAKADFDYLLGSWKRINEGQDKSTFEIWEKDDSNNYFGLGFTLQNGDTIFKEEMLLIKMKKEWLFEVSGVNEAVTPFYVRSHSKQSFMSENEENEFPKRIEYSFQNDSLKAKISDNNNEILFVFVRN